MPLSPTVNCILVPVLGGWIYGYNSGIIGGLSDPLIDTTFFPNSSESDASVVKGVLTAEILVGGFIGSFLGVTVANRFGRKKALSLCGLLCLITALLMGFISNFAILVVLRTILGLSLGIAGTVCPLYVNEVAPQNRRGQLGTVFQISICASILVAQVVNYGFAHDPVPEGQKATIADWNYHLQFALGCIPGVGLLLFSFVVPESSAYLKSGNAFVSLGQEETEENQVTQVVSESVPSSNPPPPSGDAIVAGSDPTLSTSSNPGTGVGESHVISSRSLSHSASTAAPSYSSALIEAKGGWSYLFSSHGRKWLLIGFILAFANQFTGINAVIFYSPKIFKDAGFSNPLVLQWSVVGVWNLVSVFISFALVDRLGRRPLMLGALALMCTATFLLGLAYAVFPDQKSPVAILSIILFIGGYECGPGPLFFLMAVETFPSEVQKPALSFANAIAWVFNIIISFGFPVVNNEAGPAVTFFLFCGIGAFSILLVSWFLPETKVDKNVFQKLDEGRDTKNVVDEQGTTAPTTTS